MRACATLLLLLSLPAVAQDKPNFTGKWVLDTANSDFGEFPAPEAQTNVIDHRDAVIKLTQTIRGDAIPGGQASSERRYTTDGKESSNKVGERELKSTSSWNGRTLITVTKLETPDGTVEIKDGWELADDGKQLVVTREHKGPFGVRRQRLLFVKR